MVLKKRVQAFTNYTLACSERYNSSWLRLAYLTQTKSASQDLFSMAIKQISQRWSHTDLGKQALVKPDIRLQL